jgi:hypothetical protein
MFCCQVSVWPAGQRGSSIITHHCGFDGVPLVCEAKASDDNDQDNGMFQTCSHRNATIQSSDVEDENLGILIKKVALY